MANEKVVIKHARRDDQKKVLEEIVSDGVCPFCPENLATYHKKPIGIKSKHWVVTKNQWPYNNTELQILIIAKRHIENISELTQSEWRDWTNVVAKAMKKYNIGSGAICMRFGDPMQSGASVLHLHSQIIVPDIKASEPVRFKIGSKKTNPPN